ncbi:hypothetical protein C2G38_2030120 [Gigaspora rosea]|uniref:Uncharacterized protein n=1 Tax=Gigaspora rosea TaxID=44941 RepID=A0A397VXP2_9GLOM|nr:hypothetical protein C2G38_2030120 [Gigaspora rosea]
MHMYMIQLPKKILFVFSIDKDTLTTMIYDDVELIDINLTEGKGFLCLTFFETNPKKELYIKKTIHKCQEPIKCAIFVNGLEDNILKERFEQATYLRGDYLYSNFIGPENNCEIIANLENKGLDNKIYYRIDCTLLVLNGRICANCKTLHNTLYQIENRYKNSIQSVKTTHASRELLTEIVQKARKTIRIQKELVESLHNCLKLKFEAEDEQVSEPLTGIVHNIVDKVLNKKHENISNIILKKLVHVQSSRIFLSKKSLNTKDKHVYPIISEDEHAFP